MNTKPHKRQRVIREKALEARIIRKSAKVLQEVVRIWVMGSRWGRSGSVTQEVLTGDPPALFPPTCLSLLEPLSDISSLTLHFPAVLPYSFLCIYFIFFSVTFIFLFSAYCIFCIPHICSSYVFTCCCFFIFSSAMWAFRFSLFLY